MKARAFPHPSIRRRAMALARHPVLDLGQGIERLCHLEHGRARARVRQREGFLAHQLRLTSVSGCASLRWALRFHVDPCLRRDNGDGPRGVAPTLRGSDIGDWKDAVRNAWLALSDRAKCALRAGCGTIGWAVRLG